MVELYNSQPIISKKPVGEKKKTKKRWYGSNLVGNHDFVESHSHGKLPLETRQAPTLWQDSRRVKTVLEFRNISGI